MHRLFKLLYFVMFAGLGVLMPYLPVYFETLSMSKSQIGVLSMIPNLCSFFLAPLFGIIGDVFNAHTQVLVLRMLFSVMLSLTMLSVNTFMPLLCIVFAAAAMRAPITPQVDALVITSLTDKSKYGEMRLWGAVSFGVFAFLGGAVQYFVFNFVCYAVCTLCAGCIVLYITRRTTARSGPSAVSAADNSSPQPDSSRPSMQVAMRNVLARHPSVLVFAVIVFLSGMGLGVISAFLFLRLKQLEGSGLVMGLSRFITCAAEVPMFHFAGKLQKKYGTWKMLVLTQAAFVLRFTYYSFLTNPWAVLPCEVLHGLTYATTWSVSCTFINTISPPQCRSTMQAMLEGLHWGFGGGMGALVGGYLYDHYGAVRLFEVSALLSLFSLTLAMLATVFVAPDPEEIPPAVYAMVPLAKDTEEFGLDDDQEMLFTGESVEG